MKSKKEEKVRQVFEWGRCSLVCALSLLSVVLWGVEASAQESGGAEASLEANHEGRGEQVSLTLNEMLKRLELGNHGLKQLSIERKIADAKNSEVMWKWGPKVEVDAKVLGWNDRSELEVVPKDVDMSAFAILPKKMLETFKRFSQPIVMREKFTAMFGVRLIQPLTPLLRVYQGMKLTEVNQEFHESTYSQKLIGLQHEVASLYLKMHYAKAAISTLENAKSSVRALIDLTKKYVDQGMMTRADQMEVELRLVEIEQKELDAQNKLELASVALGEKLGVDGEVMVSGSELPSSHTELKPLAYYEEEALEHRQEFRQLRFAREKSEREEKMAWLSYVPDIALVVGYDYAKGIKIQPEHQVYYGAVLKWELWDGMANAQKAKQRSLEASATAEKQLEATEKIRLQIRQKYIAVQHCLAQQKVAEKSYELANERDRIEEASFRQGESVSAKVMKSQSEAQAAELRRLKASVDTLQALSELQEASGMSPSFTFEAGR